jgi:serine phosphatase RsbU (regulator of sigma subunit)
LYSSAPKTTTWLIGVNGNERRVCLSPASAVLVGRAPHNHLVIDDPRMSRQHARIAPERDGFVVYDLGSSNGTFVNGAAVRRQVIRVGDEVRFGPWQFKVANQVEQVSLSKPTAKHWAPAESVTKFLEVDMAELQAAIAMTPQAPGAPANPHLHALRATLPPDRDFGDDAAFAKTGTHEAIAGDSAKFRAALKSVDLNQLEHAYDNLTLLYEFMQAVSKTFERNELVRLIGQRILDVFRAARTVGVYLLDVEHGEPAFVLRHVAGSGAHPPRVLLPETAHAVQQARRAIFAASAPSSAETGRTMFAPMLDRDDVLGVIFVGTGIGDGGEFKRADLELLDGIAVPSAITLQNARMHEESLRRERLNRDLELAAQIQASFLPQEVLSVPGVELVATYKAAYTIGGDFYDVFWVGPGRLAAFIGDISGKGVAAALLMARISGELRVAALAHVEPDRVLAAMNVAVLNRGQHDIFFTAIYFTLDVRTGEVRLATAGQTSPYVCRADGVVEEITDGASGAVGMLEEAEFTATRFVLQDGDSLVLYTDGVVEAKAADGSLYGEERLAACLRAGSSGPREISKRIMTSVKQHTGGAPANDDLTLFVCHRRRGAPAALQPRRYRTGEMTAPGGSTVKGSR